MAFATALTKLAQKIRMKPAESNAGRIMRGSGRQVLQETKARNYAQQYHRENVTDKWIDNGDARLKSEGYWNKKSLDRANRETNLPASKTKLVWLSPDDFLRSAAPIDFTMEDSVERLAAIRKSVHGKGENLHTIPNLWLDVGTKGVAKVSGHEGRHRAHFLKQEGVPLMPVIIKVNQFRWERLADLDNYDTWKHVWPRYLQRESNYIIPPSKREMSMGGSIEHMTMPKPLQDPVPSAGRPSINKTQPLGIDLVKAMRLRVAVRNMANGEVYVEQGVPIHGFITEEMRKAGKFKSVFDVEDGYVTPSGKFLTRAEGKKYADKWGRIKEPRNQPDTYKPNYGLESIDYRRNYMHEDPWEFNKKRKK